MHVPGNLHCMARSLIFLHHEPVHRFAADAGHLCGIPPNQIFDLLKDRTRKNFRTGGTSRYSFCFVADCYKKPGRDFCPCAGSRYSLWLYSYAPP
jgi:hypothetical protein